MPTLFTYSTVNGVGNSGALVPPNTVSWGNDVIVYNKSYSSSTQDTLKLSIAFKYKRANVNPNDFQRPVAFFLRSSNNRDISFYLNIIPHTNNVELAVTSYNYAQGTVIPLQDNNWYTVEAVFIPRGGNFGDEVFAATRVYHIGENGTAAPKLLGAHKAQIYDIGLATTEKFDIQLSGAKWGGAEYLDNFSISGKERCLTERFEEGRIVQNQCFELNGQQYCEPGQFTQSTVDENGCVNLTHITLYKTYVDTTYVTVTDTTYVTVTDTLVINTTVTGIDDEAMSNIVKVFPNPAHDAVHFDFGEYKTLANHKLVIYDMTGQVKYEAVINSKSGSVELHQLGAKGTYIIRLINAEGKQIATKKLIVR